MLITSNRSVGEWGEVFGDAVVATAILGRSAPSKPVWETRLLDATLCREGPTRVFHAGGRFHTTPRS